MSNAPFFNPNGPSLRSFGKLCEDFRQLETIWRDRALLWAQEQSNKCSNDQSSTENLCDEIAQRAFEGFKKDFEQKATSSEYFDRQKEAFLKGAKLAFLGGEQHDMMMRYLTGEWTMDEDDYTRYLRGEIDTYPKHDHSSDSSDDGGHP